MLKEYIEQLGEVTTFMPDGMKQRYHHICVEYLLLLETHDDGKIEKVLRNGVLSRFRDFDAPPVKQGLFESYIDSLVGGLHETKKMLALSTDKIRDRLKKNHDTKSMDAFLRSLQASRKIRSALDLPAAQGIHQFLEAKDLLLTSLAVNEFDYMAHMQLGWLYLWILNEPEKAEQCFDRAAIRSHKDDEYFHVFAARHLAFSYYINKKYDLSLQTIKEARKFTDNEHVLVEYEHLLYALKAKQPELIVENMEALSNDHSLYYLMIQSEPKFKTFGVLQALPEHIRKNKITSLKKRYDKRWEDSSMRLIQMEEGCNVNRVYLRTLKSYLPKLDNVSFVDLDERGDKLGDEIFSVTQAGIAAEIDKRYTMYEEEINAKRSKYAWANKFGKFIFSSSLYIIVALLVLGVYLVLDRYIIPGDSGITVNTWMIGLSGMIFALITGFIFTTFESSQVQKLYAKQKLVDEALDKLHKEDNGVSSD